MTYTYEIDEETQKQLEDAGIDMSDLNELLDDSISDMIFEKIHENDEY